MIKVNKNKMKQISGGALTLNGTIINSLIRYVNVFFEIGKALGSAIRRNKSGSICPV
jgi:hypothetical protein